MSVGPGTHPALLQGNQSTAGSDPSQHSALFYLFQEVSKLASPIHSTFVDRDSPWPWPKDASLQGSFSAEIEEREMCSFEISDPSGSPQEASRDQTKVMDQSQPSKTTPESHSPWTVLSLINLQCKRLLHHRDAEEYRPSSLLSSSPLPIDQLSKVEAKVTDQEGGSDCSSSVLSFRPSVLKCEREELASCVSADEVMIGTGVGSNPQVCGKESREDSPQSESTGKHVKANDSSPFHHEEKKEDKFSTNSQSGWNGEQAEETLSSEEVTEHLTSEDISTKTKPTHNEFFNHHLTFSSNVEAVLSLIKPDFPLDCNANLSLPIEGTREPHLESLRGSSPSSPSAAHPWINTDEGHPPIEQDDSHQEVTGALPVQQISNTQTNPPKHVDSKLELGPGEKKAAAGAATQPWRTKTPRKQPHPSRSVNIHDPDLQGVMFRMDPELDDSKEQCRLLITSEYRGCCNSLSTHRPGPSSKRVRKPRARVRTSQRSATTSSSDDETSTVSKDKICASCCTRKTPMWRNAEDGTPLCNACGIRYKKYKVRCVNCWHIPRKESNSNSTCLKCGNFVRLTSAQLKHTT